MKVYLIRHGQTVGNKEKLIQGWLDIELTEKGRSQARALAPTIGKFPFDRKYCSDLLRTKQTAALIFGEDAELIYESRVREVNSTPIAGEPRAVLLEKYGEPFAYAMRTLDYSGFGGESFEDMKARAMDFLHELEKETELKNVAVVTHGGTIHSIISSILGVKQTMHCMNIENCSVTVLKYDGKSWRILNVSNVENVLQ